MLYKHYTAFYMVSALFKHYTWHIGTISVQHICYTFYTYTLVCIHKSTYNIEPWLATIHRRSIGLFIDLVRVIYGASTLEALPLQSMVVLWLALALFNLLDQMTCIEFHEIEDFIYLFFFYGIKNWWFHLMLYH